MNQPNPAEVAAALAAYTEISVTPAADAAETESE